MITNRHVLLKRRQVPGRSVITQGHHHRLSKKQIEIVMEMTVLINSGKISMAINFKYKFEQIQYRSRSSLPTVVKQMEIAIEMTALIDNQL